ncbi:MAG: pantetheine-phosphate adenylyltransferase [Lachnospiraceae bacterium]|jgi:pantetheine-phosphate adenylyltransferase|uniref:pantetheine-phosphate adenylyltransferase n=1 Tax=Clostridium sp. (strain SY8519) TaxID=1042156 RepID=UPI0002171D3E|nr:pantetheine-phosphate adenylyltransferase [Clostridium sp. SY8519]MCI1655564.1 pantetheine-phosphate adenylyltransferase [Lachnospiraceae bacterium]MCI1657799.1 pantetheine-phosphate adenylyltransferase [Lachnospiraceae bacterium]MCI2196272.1 pantetheine-phosphate adenylyltransferase [Lachnospiraceae bacterium]BAK48253.1 hypothetical protein CXIVA_22860 [Clostridium sp. SY8519]
MSIAIYPGSFDPLTYGHLDIIERSAQMADKLIVAVLCNSAKNPLFSTDERVSMIKDLTAHIPNVSVDTFDGLTAEYADRVGATIVVRGLRAVTDFEYELQIAQTNRIVNPKLDTIFLTTNLKYSYLSSTIVKEVAQYNGDISHFVPPSIADRVRSKFSKNKEA